MEQAHDSDLWIAEFLAQIVAVDASHFPRRYKPVIRAAPRVGDVYWCAFNDRRDIALPEMWKTRPCVIVSRRNTLHGKVTVLPFSTARSNETDPMAIETSALCRSAWMAVAAGFCATTPARSQRAG